MNGFDENDAFYIDEEISMKLNPEVVESTKVDMKTLGARALIVLLIVSLLFGLTFQQSNYTDTVAEKDVVSSNNDNSIVINTYGQPGSSDVVDVIPEGLPPPPPLTLSTPTSLPSRLIQHESHIPTLKPSSTTTTIDESKVGDSTSIDVSETDTSYEETNTATSDSSFLESNLPPNILFILADDMGYHSLNDNVSPFLMSLRANGIIMSHYYSQEVCTPARAALLTGRYPISLGWQKNEANVAETGGLGLDETTIAEVLKSHGYTTFMFGKWNLGNSSPRNLPTARGFDYFLGYLDGFSNYWSKLDPTYPIYRDFLYSDNQCYYMYDWDDMDQYSSFLYRDKAVEAIALHNFSSSPMFMYLAFQAVHDPFGGRKIRSYFTFTKIL